MIVAAAEVVKVVCYDTRSLRIPSSEIVATLSSDEFRRAERFRYPELAHRYRAGRYLLRRALAEQMDCKPSEIDFALGEKGKPYLPKGPAFNMSDSESLVLVGIAEGGNLGVDIECSAPKPDLDRIAQRYFSPDECAALERMSATEKVRGFYRAWTRKEALVKALGGGLSIPLDSFSVSLEEEDGNALLHSSGEIDSRIWSIHSVAVDTRFEAAVAWDRQPSRIEVQNQAVQM